MRACRVTYLSIASGGATFAVAAAWISLAFSTSVQAAANPVAQPVVPLRQVEGYVEDIDGQQEDGQRTAATPEGTRSLTGLGLRLPIQRPRWRPGGAIAGVPARSDNSEGR